MVLTLFKLDASPPVRSVLMTIEALQLPDVEYVDVNILDGAQFEEEYMKMNPQHTIPVLKDDGFVIWDSHAIGTYLIAKYGEDDTLYPTDLQKRAVIDQRLHFDSGVLFSITRETLKPVIYLGATQLCPEGIENIRAAYDTTERFLTADWMAGDDLTFADISCVATISTMNEILAIDSSTHPNLEAWLKRCSEQEFFIKGNEPGLQAIRGLLQSKLE